MVANEADGEHSPSVFQILLRKVNKTLEFLFSNA